MRWPVPLPVSLCSSERTCTVYADNHSTPAYSLLYASIRQFAHIGIFLRYIHTGHGVTVLESHTYRAESTWGARSLRLLSAAATLDIAAHSSASGSRALSLTSKSDRQALHKADHSLPPQRSSHRSHMDCQHTALASRCLSLRVSIAKRTHTLCQSTTPICPWAQHEALP